MAMTFTLVSQLREELATLVRSRVEKRRQEEAEKERLAIEVCSVITNIWSAANLPFLIGRRGEDSWYPYHPPVIRSMESQV
jgi:hypothetical protein